MPPLNIHPPDPNHPKGMAFILGAGFVDPRPGYEDRQPMALIQSWEATSELWWQLGLRWHPELATKWLKGGGQFQVAEITDEPQDYEQNLEAAAEEVLEYIGKEHPEYAELLDKIREAKTQQDRDALAKDLGREIQTLMTLFKHLVGGKS